MIQNDPFSAFETLLGRLGANNAAGTSSAMAMDAYRRGNDVWVHLDLPGVAPDSVDINVERGVLTVTAERTPIRAEGDRPYLTERFTGKVRRQVRLGEGLDVERVEADLHDGVLTLRLPVAQQAQPRKIEVKSDSKRLDIAPANDKHASLTVS